MFLIPVATIWAVACLTPGPSTLLILQLTLKAAKRASIAAAAGTITGTLCWGIAGALGMQSLFKAFPLAFMALQIAGGLYLLWLGMRLFLKAINTAEALDLVAQVVDISPARAYQAGLLVNLTNPKAALFVASIFAVTLPAGASPVHSLAVVFVMMAISSFYYTCLIAMVSRPQVASRYLAARRLVDTGAAAVFVGFGAKLLLSQN